MIDHISIGVTDLDQSMAFYDAVLAELGYVRLWRTDSAAGYGVNDGKDKLALFSGCAAGAPAAGFHVALTAPSEQSVKRFHAAALELGGVNVGPPGLRETYSPTYYAAFVLDPDGWKLEAVHQAS